MMYTVTSDKVCIMTSTMLLGMFYLIIGRLAELANLIFSQQSFQTPGTQQVISEYKRLKTLYVFLSKKITLDRIPAYLSL